MVEGGAGNPDLEEVEPEPLDLSIPLDSCTKTVTYFVLLPIVFPLWLTLPDTRKRSCKYQDQLCLHNLVFCRVVGRRRRRTSPLISPGPTPAGKGLPISSFCP